jgi:hypothetical protein
MAADGSIYPRSAGAVRASAVREGGFAVRNLVWVLIILSVVGFVGAVAGALTGRLFLGVQPEGYSRACTNLALIAIALLLVPEKKG